MARRNWKNVRATSITNGLELCIQHARDKRNKSVQQIAELMGLPNHSTLYKWLESGRMPAVMIRPFEHACGAEFVTQYLATSANKLLVEIPSGKRSEHKELNELSVAAHSVIGMLISFYDGDQSTDETLNALTGLMEDLAHQRGNIQKHQQPELL
ncbi:hypothetical protein QKW35_14605 [Pontibacterium granulatum]|uniref:hypothetical protein n=1 Tax=Pontibacterium granulatum TaxID=2036029 RepID=UPI00249BAB57|nr:hypothetical protein [Pontibacterium granulatum]MDI3325606.1 hypothetical protein [Pontibacterium granulatum]